MAKGFKVVSKPPIEKKDEFDIEAAKEATLKKNHDTEDNIAQTTASGVKLTPDLEICVI